MRNRPLIFRAALASLALAALSLPSLHAQFDEQEVLIPSNADWDYLLYAPAPGFVPSDPTLVDGDFYTTWYIGGEEYDGPAFEPGAAPLGYGAITGDPIATNIWGARDGLSAPPDTARFSAYFRTTFTPTDEVTAINVSGIVDDGAILYIDGVELVRTANFEDGAVDEWNLLTSVTGSETAPVEGTITGLNLPAGVEVVIGVSLHSAAVDSSDLGMNFRLASVIPAEPSPPDNDDFANAEVLNPILPVTVTGRTHDGSAARGIGATIQAGEPDHHGVTNVGSIWYDFLPAVSGPVKVSVDGSSFTSIVVAVYTGASIDALTPIASTAGETPFYAGTTVVFNASDTEAYWIVVSGESNGGVPVLDENFGDVTLTVEAGDPLVLEPIATLLPPGSDWLYLLAAEDDPVDLFLTNQPVDPALFGAGDPDFHSTWHTGSAYDGPTFLGPSPALLGYGETVDPIDADPIITDIWGGRDIDGEPATVDLAPPEGERYAAYFRTTFTPESEVTHIGFRGLIDDGAVIFINGVETARMNFDGDAADWQAFAGTAVNTETAPQEAFALNVDLPAGVPVEVGVSVRSNSATSSDLAFDMAIFSIEEPVIDFGKDLATNEPLLASFDTGASAAVVGLGDMPPADNLPWATTAGNIRLESELPNPPANPGLALYVNSGSLNFSSGRVDLLGVDNALVTAAIDLRIVDTSSGFEAADTVEAWLEGSTDGIFFTRIATILPLLAGADPDPGPLKRLELPGGAYTTFRSEAGDIPAEIRTVRIVVAGVNTSLSEHIYVDNVIIGSSIGPGPALLATISRNPVTGANQIDWNFEEGNVYELYYGTDLETWTLIFADSDVGTFTHTPPAGDEEGFYHVRRFAD